MNNLISITDDSNEVRVSGRMLHGFLEVNSNYTTWFKRMCDYGFSEGVDFIPNLKESTGGRPSFDHIMTLSMAKEICMIQRSDKGKEARRYFIQIEKEWNTPEKVMARALVMVNKQKEELLAKIAHDEHKVTFADAVSDSDGCVSVKEMAAILTQSGFEIGEKRLFAWLRENGYLCKKKGTSWNEPIQKYSEMGIFKIIERPYSALGQQQLSITTRVTGKGQLYFLRKFKKLYGQQDPPKEIPA